MSLLQIIYIWNVLKLHLTLLFLFLSLLKCLKMMQLQTIFHNTFWNSGGAHNNYSVSQLEQYQLIKCIKMLIFFWFDLFSSHWSTVLYIYLINKLDLPFWWLSDIFP